MNSEAIYTINKNKMKNNKSVWVEKYRPNNINNIIKQDEIKQFFNGAIKEKNIPHLLLYGPPGTGKTTIANALVKQLFSYNKSYFSNRFEWLEATSKLYNDRVLELNSSNERGIKVVREKIKTFANLSITMSKNKRDEHIPPFKVIILDEADAMTTDSQFALRRIMEKYSHNTRFILICNYVTKIIAPLSSRCSKFKFLPIDIENTKIIMKDILKSEEINVDISDDIYDYIYQYTNGDLRKTITLFQRLTYTGYINDLSINYVRELIGEIPEYLIDKIINIIEKEQTIETQYEIYKICKKIIYMSYNCLFLINHLYYHFLYSEKFNDLIKGKIIDKLSEVDNKLNNGSIEIIQIIDLFIYINNVVNE